MTFDTRQRPLILSSFSLLSPPLSFQVLLRRSSTPPRCRRGGASSHEGRQRGPSIAGCPSNVLRDMVLLVGLLRLLPRPSRRTRDLLGDLVLFVDPLGRLPRSRGGVLGLINQVVLSLEVCSTLGSRHSRLSCLSRNVPSRIAPSRSIQSRSPPRDETQGSQNQRACSGSHDACSTGNARTAERGGTARCTSHSILLLRLPFECLVLFHHLGR
mmetsp:Transcript_13660/g.27154  ORF Transcript_13660/g.27154 Transcript_13660/m.27154 type:complete len:213 (+) Transcript_13660:786-1424(+)